MKNTNIHCYVHVRTARSSIEVCHGKKTLKRTGYRILSLPVMYKKLQSPLIYRPLLLVDSVLPDHLFFSVHSIYQSVSVPIR